MSIREAVGVFDDLQKMQDAIQELEISGFGRRHISVLGSEDAVKKHFGTSHIEAELLEDNPETPKAPNVKPEELNLGQGALISGGLLTGAIAVIIASGGLALPGAAIPTVMIGSATGAAIGGVLAKLLGDKYAEFFQKQINEGGLVVWVKTSNDEEERKALEVLEKHGGKHVHTHELAVKNKEENSSEQHRLCEMLVKLESLRNAHQPLIADDMVLSDKLWRIFVSIEQSAADPNGVTEEETREIYYCLEDAISYTRNMAEKEQRLLADSMPQASISHKNVSFNYLRFAIGLSEFQNLCREKLLCLEHT